MGQMGRAFDGGYAEYALLRDELLIPVGTSLGWPVLGALPETYLTAWGAMHWSSIQAASATGESSSA
jgi:NADPH:quinone reductase-like Zn-dependent oxidoreductase